MDDFTEMLVGLAVVLIIGMSFWMGSNRVIVSPNTINAAIGNPPPAPVTKPILDTK